MRNVKTLLHGLVLPLYFIWMALQFVWFILLIPPIFLIGAWKMYRNNKQLYKPKNLKRWEQD